MNLKNILIFFFILVNVKLFPMCPSQRTIAIENQTGLTNLSLEFMDGQGNVIDPFDLVFTDNMVYFRDNLDSSTGSRLATCPVLSGFYQMLPNYSSFTVTSDSSDCDTEFSYDCPTSWPIPLPVLPNVYRKYTLKCKDSGCKNIVAYYGNTNNLDDPTSGFKAGG